VTRSERAVTVLERAERRVINEHMPAEYLASQRDFRPLAHAIADACEKARSECSRISGFYRFGFGSARRIAPRIGSVVP